MPIHRNRLNPTVTIMNKWKALANDAHQIEVSLPDSAYIYCGVHHLLSNFNGASVAVYVSEESPAFEVTSYNSPNSSQTVIFSFQKFQKKSFCAKL